MSLYAIGDLHLHFQSALKAPGQLKGKIWQDHERVFRENCLRLIRPGDTLVLAGDHSWGRNLSECEADLDYIASLPGRKILLRGNHDMFWDAKKTAQLNETFSGSLYFLQNNYFAYKDYALVGTKGYTFEGPFYLNRAGRVIGWDEEKEGGSYYYSKETTKLAQELLEDKDMQMLIAAARDCSPEDLQMAANFLKRLKRTLDE